MDFLKEDLLITFPIEINEAQTLIKQKTMKIAQLSDRDTDMNKVKFLFALKNFFKTKAVYFHKSFV